MFHYFPEYSSDSESDKSESENEAVQPMTEQEKNQIGAKIVKAELMGNNVSILC